MAFLGQVLVARKEYDVFYIYSLHHLSVGIFEEIIFRGIFLIVMIKVLARFKYGIYFSLVFSSLIFGLIHIFNGTENINEAVGITITTGLMGLYLGGLFILCRNIVLPGLVHAAINITFDETFGEMNIAESSFNYFLSEYLVSILFVLWCIGFSIYNTIKADKKAILAEVNLIGWQFSKKN